MGNYSKHKTMNILLYIWQLPQTLLGYILLLFWKQTGVLEYKGKTVRVCKTFPSGISLGYVIILNKYPYSKDTWNDVKHEYGHSVQSERCGWLYLFVIGLPSLIGNIWDRLFHSKWDKQKANEWYYNQPWEKGADKLGGVER